MKLTVGIVAHVDAGKTTFSEQILYQTGALRSIGRVDHGDSFLDADPIEKRRGITIFSDQSYFEHNGDRYYWLDTPGHVDFSPEMERAVEVMDYAIVIISCVEGVQSHTESVWKLLSKHQIPTFIFINKTDRAGADIERVLGQIKRILSTDCVMADGLTVKYIPDSMREAVAERNEKALEKILDDSYEHVFFAITLKALIKRRELFPVFTGAALLGNGIREFLEAFFGYTYTKYDESAPLKGRIYKIRHDEKGLRIIFAKIDSGTVSVRDELPYGRVTELRVYKGQRYESVKTAGAGDLVAVIGLSGARVGMRLDDDIYSADPTFEPMLSSTCILPAETRLETALRALKEIEEEEPTLSVQLENGALSVRVMGEIQLEVLKELTKKRYGIDIEFGKRQVLFLETISSPVIGIGHYEPLKHYAEVHLRLLPSERDSGISFESKCHVDDLALTWQRLIETHVFEIAHRGVLIGAPITDIKIQLLAGRAHLKHTEGGDFREATYRAIRNALMKAESVILEPLCRFTLKAPSDMYGKLSGELLAMKADLNAPEYASDSVIMSGEVTFRRISGFVTELNALTHGRALLNYEFSRYVPVDDQDSLVQETRYNPYSGISPDSIFCAKGAGYNVNWKEVSAMAHVPQEYSI